MLIDFTIANYGPFLEPVTLSFVAATDAHLEPAYVRTFSFPNKKQLRLLRAAIIYGPNAAGKTTVLEALSLLDSLVTTGKEETTTPIDVNSFAFQDNAQSKPTEMSIRFIRDSRIYRYSIKVNQDAVLFEKLEIMAAPPAGTVYTLVYERQQGAARDVIQVKYGKSFTLTEAQKAKLQAELQTNTTVLYTLNKKMAMEGNLAKEAFQFFGMQLMGEVGPKSSLKSWVTRKIEKDPKLANFVIQQLRQVGISLQGFQIETPSLKDWQIELLEKDNDISRRERMRNLFQDDKAVFTQYKVNSKNYQLSLTQESLGTQRYYEVAGLLSVLCGDAQIHAQQSRVLPMDEMEHSLHPELIKHFWLNFLRHEGNSQIITTSHYRELLQDRMLFRDDVIWFVDKNHATMSSSLYALEDVKVEAGLRSTSSVYNYYVQGRLGATPQMTEDEA